MVISKDLKLYSYQLPVLTQRWPTREGFLLQREDRWGEIAPLPGFSRETLADALAEIKALWPDLSRATLPSVRFGFASLQKPLRSIRLPLAALSPRPGFTTLKLKVGHLSVSEAVSLVQTYKSHYRLRIDCNRAWNLEQALTFATHFQPTDFAHLEEPLHTFDELMQFSEITHFPLAIDESLLDSPWQKLPSLKAVVVKPTIVGAIPLLPPHVDLILSSAYESGLGLLHIARLSHEHQLSHPIGLDTYTALKEDLLTTPIDCSAGFFSWNFSDPPINEAKLCPIAL